MMKDQSAPVRRVQRVRHELKRRELCVLRTEQLSPHFRRIVFGGDTLAGFVSAGFDDHIKIFLPHANGETAMRDYTPRHYDASTGELTIEFALHGEGPAAEWAAQAGAGDTLTIAGPRGSFVIPTDYDWHLLIGDETALPAISRRLDELPSGTRVFVLALTEDPADWRELATDAELQQQWFNRSDALLDAVRGFSLPDGEGYVWCAGEATVSAEARRILVEEKGHDRKAIRAAAYWKHGAANHHETIDSGDNTENVAE